MAASLIEKVPGHILYYGSQFLVFYPIGNLTADVVPLSATWTSLDRESRRPHYKDLSY